MVKFVRKVMMRPPTKPFVPLHVRTDVGVISPFAITEATLGKKINWTTLKAEAGRALLEEGLKADYSSLFTPLTASPLYLGLPTVRTALKSPPVVRVARPDALVAKAADIVIIPAVIPIQKGVVKPGVTAMAPSVAATAPPKQTLMSAEVATPTVATGAPLPCTAAINWGTDPNWQYPPPPAPQGDYSPLFGTHPIQGCAADCYFIAALSSLAWVDPDSLWVEEVGPGLYSHTFDEADGNLNPHGRPSPYEVDKPLPTNTNTNEPAYAHSRIPDQVWPAVYEKAFAKFKGIMPPNAPNVPGLGFGNPIHALICLSFMYGTARLTTGYTGHVLWQEINQLCGSAITGDKTQYPMVAWTYPERPSDEALSYSTDILVANHSYSIFGTANLNGRECIVLRNPYVYSVAGAPPQGVVDGTWDFTDWYGIGGTDGPRMQMKLRTTNGSIGDGTFALEADAFVRYFEGAGWVGI